MRALLQAMLDRHGDSTWFDDNRDNILAAAREAVAGEDHRTASTFLATAWTLVSSNTPTEWCDALRECGHTLISAAPDSPELAAVFRTSAAVYHARGDYRFAEVEGLHELAVWRSLDDPDEHVAALDSLTRTFLARDRLHRAMDCADERLAVHIQHNRHREIAADFQHLGSLMLLADRPSTAVDHLTRSRDAFDALPDVPSQQHARIRVLLGRALWQAGSEAAARREFSDALRLTVDVDEHAADQIRALLSTPAGGQLPVSVPEDVDE